MRQYYIREAGMLTVLEARSPWEALVHYGHVHGWKIPEDMLQEVRTGVWSLFHGELMLFSEDPRTQHTTLPDAQGALAGR